jgi:2-keto-4-pentenoate hydratase/2-oxohepta-3-ene-1,7-dioic acid hydratase in catechol pathway
VVIGTYAKDISPDDADEVIAGYTIGLDMSNRQLRLNPNRIEQSRTAFHEWLCGKWHDGFAPIGPCIVPNDETFDPTEVDISLAVNGQVMQQSNTSNMVFDVYEIVSYASKIMTLEPGDMIMTGTPSGVGAARGIYLRSGDHISATIEGIGTLEVEIA